MCLRRPSDCVYWHKSFQASSRVGIVSNLLQRRNSLPYVGRGFTTEAQSPQRRMEPTQRRPRIVSAPSKSIHLGKKRHLMWREKGIWGKGLQQISRSRVQWSERQGQKSKPTV